MDDGHLLQTVTECTGISKNEEGVFYDGENGRTEVDGQSLVSMNLWGFHPAIFDLLQNGFNEFVAGHTSNARAEFYISSFANQLINDKTAAFSVLPNNEKWYGVTYKEDKATVQEAFKNMTDSGKYPSPLWA
jgi:hypothetical protein